MLAPLAAPLIASAIMASQSSRNGGQTFLFFFGLGSAFSYGVCLFLFLPCLFVLSRFTKLTCLRTVLFGTLLGLALYFPIGWQSYLASGDNSGPPAESFVSYLGRNFWAESWLFYGSGLITTLVYWFLARPLPAKRVSPSS